MLADAAAIRRGTTFDSVLASCWEGTDAPGPYPPAVAGEKVDWTKILVADRLVAMIHIRVATYGPEYGFGLQCSSNMCRKRFDWDIDLVRDVPVKSIPEEALAAFASGNRLECSAGGFDLVFKLLVGSDETKSRALRGASIMTDALAARIVEFKGVHPNDRVRTIEDLGMPAVREILDALDRSDGGVETELEVECPHCQNVMEVQLPFGKEFFLPTTKRKTLLGGSSRASRRRNSGTGLPT